MQWNKAKNLMLMFFLLLNGILFALINQESTSHILTREQETAIQAIFAQNNINMYTAMPRDFSPMRALRLAPFDYDVSRLLDMFFPYYAEILHSSPAPYLENFVWQNKELTISNNYISFNIISDYPCEESETPEEIESEIALALTDAFINSYYPDFRLDAQSTRRVEEGLRLTYRQVFQDVLIYTNFVEFLVTNCQTEPSITQVEIQYQRPVGFAYMPRELHGPHEALLSFVQHVRIHSAEPPILITHMDIVYFREIGDNPLYAVPYYRIFIQGHDWPFLVNAYTNRI